MVLHNNHTTQWFLIVCKEESRRCILINRACKIECKECNTANGDNTSSRLCRDRTLKGNKNNFVFLWFGPWLPSIFYRNSKDKIHLQIVWRRKRQRQHKMIQWELTIWTLNIESNLHQKAHVQRSPMYQCPASLSRISYNTVPEGFFNTVDTAYFASYVWETPKNPLTAPRVPALAPGFLKKVEMKQREKIWEVEKNEKRRKV